jgi:hypothetical protein
MSWITPKLMDACNPWLTDLQAAMTGKGGTTRKGADEDDALAAPLRGLDHGEQLQGSPSGRRMMRRRGGGHSLARGGAGSGAAKRRHGVGRAGLAMGAAARGRVRRRGGKGSGAAARLWGVRVHGGQARRRVWGSRENMENYRDQMKNRLQITDSHMYQNSLYLYFIPLIGGIGHRKRPLQSSNQHILFLQEYRSASLYCHHSRLP